jgi:hypothetical protein
MTKEQVQALKRLREIVEFVHAGAELCVKANYTPDAKLVEHYMRKAKEELHVLRAVCVE